MHDDNTKLKGGEELKIQRCTMLLITIAVVFSISFFLLTTLNELAAMNESIKLSLSHGNEILRKNGQQKAGFLTQKEGW